MNNADFAQRVLSWQRQYGRHDLPWQHPRTPYRVWLSEIMLQQTTVAVVIPYFQRFEARFPSVESLAAATLDEVLQLWQGLGYYARARNLHACAQQICSQHAGEFPRSRAALEELPGIGRSTAAAICAQAYGQQEAILDGNVKRLLARHAGIEGWPGQASVQKQLWQLAESRLPPADLTDYTQGLMDLGAALCRSRGPDCSACPVTKDCVAHIQGRTAEIPGRKEKAPRPQRHCFMVVQLDSQGRIHLQRRPPSGIWGGLWCLPEHGQRDEIMAIENYRALPQLKHVFTHFELHIQPMLSQVSAAAEVRDHAAENDTWVAPERLSEYGLPSPVRKILASLPQPEPAPLLAPTEE